VSVLDDFRAAEQRVAQRLKELAPAVAEYRELEAVAQRLGIGKVGEHRQVLEEGIEAALLVAATEQRLLAAGIDHPRRRRRHRPGA